MNPIFSFVLHNTIAAFALALVAGGVKRLWRNPPLEHSLWLLALLRLVAPPLLSVDYAAILPFEWTYRSGPPAAATPGAKQASDGDVFAGQATTAAAGEANGDAAKPLQVLLLSVWGGGAAACALVIAARVAKFNRLLRGALPASERMQRLAVEIAVKFGASRAPDVRFADSVEAPLLWCAGLRPTIVLPARLLWERDDERMALILAHEIAHYRRRDHWVRMIELAVSIVYWWHPLCWAIRRQIHDAEELCCDAWVCRLLPASANRYAEVLFEAAESLGASPRRARLLPVSLLLSPCSLKARIEMILEHRCTPFVSKKSLLAVALFASVALPLGLQNGKPVRADAKPEAPSRNAAKASSEFPYAVQFEQGATRFADGDKLTILEIRGTAETFTPGNIYWIKGYYKLTSRDKAALAAFTTAQDAANGAGSYLKVQSTEVERGEGTFTLFLPMSCRGWPHVSFYPAEGGESFGGNYFGTGDSVLKKWWGEKEAD